MATKAELEEQIVQLNNQITGYGEALKKAPPPLFITITLDEFTSKLDFRSNARNEQQLKVVISSLEQVTKIMRDSLIEATEQRVRKEMEEKMAPDAKEE